MISIDSSEAIQEKNRPSQDDLKQIKGIGPGIEERLHQAGIVSFSRLAACTPEELAAMLAGLSGISAARVNKQGWIRQAQQLAQQAPISESDVEKPVPEARMEKSDSNLPVAETLPTDPPPDKDEREERQGYATFTVEFLLNLENDVRRTRVAFVQGDCQDIWAGWDSTRLVNFFVNRAGLRVPTVESRVLLSPAEDKELDMESVLTPDESSGAVRLQELTVVRRGEYLSRILAVGQPLHLHLVLDLTDLSFPGNQLFDYTARIEAKNLGGGPRCRIAEITGTAKKLEPVLLDIEGHAPPSGLYRLEARVSVTPVKIPATEDQDLQAFLEGGLLQIY